VPLICNICVCEWEPNRVPIRKRIYSQTHTLWWWRRKVWHDNTRKADLYSPKVGNGRIWKVVFSSINSIECDWNFSVRCLTTLRRWSSRQVRPTRRTRAPWSLARVRRWSLGPTSTLMDGLKTGWPTCSMKWELQIDLSQKRPSLITATLPLLGWFTSFFFLTEIIIYLINIIFYNLLEFIIIICLFICMCNYLSYSFTHFFKYSFFIL